MRVLVLPGLDGGASLSGRFRELLGERFDVVGVEYPAESWAYDELVPYVRAEVARSEQPVTLVAESFSGPIAVRIAEAPPPQLRAVVLVATFARPPAPSALRALARPLTFRLPPPRFALRRFMLDPTSDPDELTQAISQVAPEVLSQRVREVLTVDVRDALGRVSVPTLAIVGARDRIVPQAASVIRDRPDLGCCTLDAPHLVLSCRPRAAADAVTAFVGGLAC